MCACFDDPLVFGLAYRYAGTTIWGVHTMENVLPAMVITAVSVACALHPVCLCSLCVAKVALCLCSMCTALLKRKK